MLLTAASLIVIVKPHLPCRYQQSSPIALKRSGFQDRDGAHLLTQRYPGCRQWASDARYVIPIAGMIVGNSRNVASVRRGGHCEPGRARSRALAPQADGRIIGP